MKSRSLLNLILLSFVLIFTTSIRGDMQEKIKKSEDEWKKKLNEEQYYVCRQKGTERPFTGKYYDHHEDGVYTCAACGNELFDSKTKYESGSGWPSFWAPFIEEGSVITKKDYSHGMIRFEVMCAKCDSHLGHVFDDGPKPTNQRYCINSIALNFKKR